MGYSRIVPRMVGGGCHGMVGPVKKEKDWFNPNFTKALKSLLLQPFPPVSLYFFSSSSTVIPSTALPLLCQPFQLPAPPFPHLFPSFDLSALPLSTVPALKFSHHHTSPSQLCRKSRPLPLFFSFSSSSSSSSSSPKFLPTIFSSPSLHTSNVTIVALHLHSNDQQ